MTDEKKDTMKAVRIHSYGGPEVLVYENFVLPRPIAGLTAWQALFEKAHVTADQTILILGAAGVVGHLAVQLAKSHGAHVLGTASTRNIKFLHSIGVNQVIDYTTTPLETAVHNVD